MSYLRGSAAASQNLDHALRSRELGHLRPNLEAGIFRKRLQSAENLYHRNLPGHYGCVNALEFSHGGEYLASGGDDKRVLLWNVDQTLANLDKAEPNVMYGEHASNIFCLGFDTQNTYVFSGGNDELVIQHDLATGKNLNYFTHDGPVYGLSVDRTTNSLFSVATEHGEILIYDLRLDKTDPLSLAKYRSPFNAVEFHPLNGNYLATANAKRGAQLWDIRHHTQALFQYNYITESPSCMSVRFNCNGSLLLTLHRRLPPILYSVGASEPLCSFYHDEYFNSCTMKSCTFAGPQDELIVSGSDNFNMFIWRLDGVDLEKKNQWVDTLPVILTGHRSIVNQVRYNRERCMLASSGVEKIIKFWSPFAQHGWEGALVEPSDTPYCTRVLHRNATDHVSQDFSTRNVEEDQVMLAFFDTLVQRELETWNSNSSTGNGNGQQTASSASSSGSSSEHTDSSTQSEEQSEVDTPNVSELSWQTHPNRIFYLIAKKRRALLQLAVKGTGGHSRNVEQLLARLLGEQRQVATQARISEWLEETHRLFGDDELPTTSAEAAARERNLRESISQPTSRSPRKPPELRMIGSLQASFEQLERKRKLMRLRFAAIKRRRTIRHPHRDTSEQEDRAVAYDSEYMEDEEEEDDDNEPEPNVVNENNDSNNNSDDNDDDDNDDDDDDDDDDDTSNTSMEAQLSQAPSTSNSIQFVLESNEANNNSQMAENHNNKMRNGLSPAGTYHSETTTSTSSSSQANI